MAIASQAPPTSSTPATTAPRPAQPNYDLFKSLDFSSSSSTTTVTPPATGTAFRSTSASFPTPGAAPAVKPLAAHDPFAALSTPARQGSPFQYQQSTQRPTTPQSGGKALNSVAALRGATAGAASSNRSSLADDEWNFSSALPDAAHEIAVASGDVGIGFVVSRVGEALVIRSAVSNNTPAAVGDFTFQMAVMKVRGCGCFPVPRPCCLVSWA